MTIGLIHVHQFETLYLSMLHSMTIRLIQVMGLNVNLGSFGVIVVKF